MKYIREPTQKEIKAIDTVRGKVTNNLIYNIEEKGKLEKKMFGSYDCELDCFAIHHGKYGVHVLYIEAKGSCNGLRKAYQKQIPRGVECLIEKYKIPKDRIIRVVAWGDEDRNIKYKIIK